MAKDKVQHLKNLGAKSTKYKYKSPDKFLIEVFENQFPYREYVTEFIFNEFTSLCPKTGQPDFATIEVSYIPDKKCIETKSLKLYFLSYRNEGAFMETIINQILEDLVDVCNPIFMQVKGNFNARGGTLINVIAKYNKTV